MQLGAKMSCGCLPDLAITEARLECCGSPAATASIKQLPGVSVEHDAASGGSTHVSRHDRSALSASCMPRECGRRCRTV